MHLGLCCWRAAVAQQARDLPAKVAVLRRAEMAALTAEQGQVEAGQVEAGPRGLHQAEAVSRRPGRRFGH